MPETDQIMVLLTVGGTYLLLILLSLFFYFKPPQTINSLYGYRTSRSMKNPENWHFANKLSARFMIKGSVIGLLIFLVSFVFLKGQIAISTLTLANLIVLCISLVAVIPLVEIKLKKFEKSRS